MARRFVSKERRGAMPNNNSAVKRMRRSAISRERNKAVRSEITSVRNEVQAVLGGKEADAAKKVFSRYCSVLDKAAKRGVIGKNTAIRRKRRASQRLAKVAAT